MNSGDKVFYAICFDLPGGSGVAITAAENKVKATERLARKCCVYGQQVFEKDVMEMTKDVILLNGERVFK